MDHLADLASLLLDRRPAVGCFIVGITGGVAAGKTTLAAALRTDIEAWPDRPRVELACTDGFIRTNADLALVGLENRKGFPESYDVAALQAALIEVRRGPALFPGYSHLIYDVDPLLGRHLDRPDVLLIEGLGLWEAPPLDCLIYVDAAEDDLAAWFTARFIGLWEAGKSDPSSFYGRFAHLTLDAVEAIAGQVWTGINLPNIRANVAPLRDAADIVVRKAADHRIVEIYAPRASG